jgi:hypothetical protein
LRFGVHPIEKFKVAQDSTIAARGACLEGEIMTREAKLMSGIILITVPTIQYGGYFLLTSLMTKGSGYMDNPLRRTSFVPGMPTRAWCRAVAVATELGAALG